MPPTGNPECRRHALHRYAASQPEPDAAMDVPPWRTRLPATPVCL